MENLKKLQKSATGGRVVLDDVKINGQDIIISNKEITLKYAVKMLEIINGLYIILLDVPKRIELGEDEINNIVCYSEDGEFRWRVDDKLPRQITSPKEVPYVAIQIQDNILKATDFIGRRFHIDEYSGKLTEFEIVE